MRRAIVVIGCAALAAAECGRAGAATRRGATVLYASGADLQSVNPLLTEHPLENQVQRYVLLTTLVRYDSSLPVQPYLARRWSWSRDRSTLTMVLYRGLMWADGRPTVSRDVAWPLDAARDPAVGFPRFQDVASLGQVQAPDDSTVVIRFQAAQTRIPDVLTDLAILPAHLLDTVPRERLRQAAWNEEPVGNGPFRFVAHQAHRRRGVARHAGFPPGAGGG